MKSLGLTERLSGFSGAGCREGSSGRTFLGGGGGTSNSSGTGSGPSSAIPSNTGEACPAKNYILLMHECITIRLLYRLRLVLMFSGCTLKCTKR